MPQTKYRKPTIELLRERLPMDTLTSSPAGAEIKAEDPPAVDQETENNDQSIKKTLQQYLRIISRIH